MSSDQDLLALIASILKFEAKGGTASDFARGLVHNVLADLDAQTALVARLEFDGKVRFMGRYGFDAKVLHGIENISVWDDSIICESIRKRVIISADHAEHRSYTSPFSPEWPGASFVAIPLIQDEQALGVVGISFAKTLPVASADETFWKIIQLACEAHFISVWAAEARGELKNKASGEPESLSERQLKILVLLMAGKTNKAIGAQLRLSESSIKQETMRIFRSLGVSNRKQAAVEAAKLGLK